MMMMNTTPACLDFVVCCLYCFTPFAISVFYCILYPNRNPNKHKKQETAFLHQKTNRFEGLTWRRYQRGSHYFAIGMKPKDDRSHYRAAKVAFWMEWLPRISEPRNSTGGIPGGEGSSFGPFSCPTGESVDSRDEWKPRKVPYDIFSKNKPTKKPHSRELSITISVGITLLVVNVVVFSMCYYRRDKMKLSAEDKHTMTLLNGRNRSPPAVEVVEVGSTDGACPTSDAVPSKLCDAVPSKLCDAVPSGLCDAVPSKLCDSRVSRRSQDSGIKSPINSTDSIDIDTPRKKSLCLED
ncbi:neuroligin-4, Y-linked-like [Branchiostoma floridae x Branchiostoma belcheri]